MAFVPLIQSSLITSVFWRIALLKSQCRNWPKAAWPSQLKLAVMEFLELRKKQVAVRVPPAWSETLFMSKTGISITAPLLQKLQKLDM